MGRQLAEADVAAFEAEREIRLPESYRSLLLRVNGGYPQNGAFEYSEGRSFALKRLFPLTDEVEKFFNLRKVNHATSDAPAGFLKIGSSYFGDDLCLGVEEPHYGHVIYLDHEERDPDAIDEDDWLGVYPLADRFEDFMLALVRSE